MFLFESGNYPCNDCETMCNSNGELQQHILNQHTENESFVDDMVQPQELTEKAKQLLIEANLYPANYIKELGNFNVMQDLEWIKKLGSNLKICKKSQEKVFILMGIT